VPYCTASRPASTTDPATWLTLEAALALAAAESMAGVGFVFTADDPYTGIDLDECRDAATGAIQPWAQRLIERLASYTEVSPSGTGVHIIVQAKLPGGGRKQSRPGGVGAVEVYDQKRYFTVTGQVVPETPATIAANQDVVADIYARLKDDTPAAVESSTVASGPLAPEDELLVARVEASRESPAFHRLFSAGETRPNRTASENDLELATILCRYASDDDQVERIMRASPLKRDKWDRKGDDYLRRTILTARRKTGTTAGTSTAEAGFVDFGEVHDSPPPAVGWLVDGIWPEGARGWIAGEAKLGKSWLALELAVCIAAGVPFLNRHEVIKPGLVFYLTEESNLRNIYNRVRMLLLAKDLSPDVLRGNLRMLVRKRVKLTDPSWRTRILTAIDRDKPVMLFLDPLRRYHDGGENDSADLVAVLDAAAEFQERPGHHVAVPIVHHMRKTSEANADVRTGQQMRGSGDLHAWSDAAFYCSGIKDEKNVVAVEVELKDAESPPSFIVGIDYGPPEDILVGAETIQMRPARLTVRDEVSLDEVKIRTVADKIHAFLTEQTERQTVSAIKVAVSGKDKLIAPALAWLKLKGRADVESGPRRSQLWAATKASPDNPIEEDLPF
jgi:AAA domain-containing protein/primase/DNA polymerase family protein